MSIFSGYVSFGNVGGGGSVGTIVTAADFSGDDYQNNSLIGLTADTDFFLYSNDGSGALLKVDDGYTFNSATGTITSLFGAGNFRILIF